MCVHIPEHGPVGRAIPAGEHDRERRLQLLVRRLPPRVQGVVHRLRRPTARWMRIPAGLLLIVGSLFFILPVFGLWMLPLGLVLLAEDIPPLRRATGRVLAWIEQRRPHWMGLPHASHHQRRSAERETS